MFDISTLPEKGMNIYNTALEKAKSETDSVAIQKSYALEQVLEVYRNIGGEWVEKSFTSIEKEPVSFISHKVSKSDVEFDETGFSKALTTEQRNKLPDSDFAYVETLEDGTKVRKLPINDAEHVRNALSRFNQTEGIPGDKKKAVLRKIVSRAKTYGIEVSEDILNSLE